MHHNLKSNAIFMHLATLLVWMIYFQRKDLTNHVLSTQNVKTAWTVLLDVVLVLLHITESFLQMMDVSRVSELRNITKLLRDLAKYESDILDRQ